MSVLTQGTQVFMLLPPAAGAAGNTVMKVECATALNPGGSPKEQIEDTCLESMERTYKPGLRTPGQATLNLNADPANVSHVTLHQLSELGGNTNMKWAVGFSDGTAVPTVAPAGSLALISVTDGGTGYTTAPTVTITGGGGTGASATALINAGKVVAVTVTAGGTGYTSAPVIGFTGGAGTGAAAEATYNAAPDFALPSTRTWFLFEGYVADFPFDFAANAVVATAVSIQRSGGSAWIRKIA